MTKFKEYQEEQRNLKLLKAGVDALCERIKTGVAEEEYESGKAEARALCESLFPDKLLLFDMIYLSRFERLREQFRAVNID